FKYNFEKGKPWQSETLYAPFNIDIQKSVKESAEERQSIIDQSVLYFNEATSVETQVRELFDETFSKTFSASISNTVFNDLSAVGHTIIDELYHFGGLSEVYDFPEDRAVVILEERVKKHSTTCHNLVQQNEIKPIIEKTLSETDFEAYANVFVSLFFDLVQPNLTYNESFTEKALKDDLDNISYSRGSIEKQTLIISKGEII